jgi:hypothetical protein
MALINYSTDMTNGLMGIQTRPNMLVRNGKYYVFYTSGTGVYGNNALYYRVADTVEGLSGIADSALITSYAGAPPQDIHGYNCAAYTFKYDEVNDTLLFVASTYYPAGAYPTYLRAATGSFNPDGTITASAAHTINENTDDEYFAHPNICKLNSGKWAIINPENIYNVNPFGGTCQKINVYVSANNTPNHVSNWSSGNLITAPGALSAYELSITTATCPVDDTSDDFLVTYITKSGNFTYPRSKRWDADTSGFGAEVTIDNPFYDTSSRDYDVYYMSNMELNSSNIPTFVKCGVNDTLTASTSNNSGVYLNTYDKDTDSWTSTKETGAIADAYGGAYYIFAPCIKYIDDTLFLAYRGNVGGSSTPEARLALKQGSGAFHDGSQHLDPDVTGVDPWSGAEQWFSLDSYDNKLLMGYGLRQRFGSPDYTSMYMTEANVQAWTSGIVYISNVDELQRVGNEPGWEPNSTYIQIADIDASETSTWNNGSGFIPIGTTNPFIGTYDGQGFTISGLYIERLDQSYVGLFGKVGVLHGDGATITDVKVIDSYVAGYEYTGGIVADGSSSVISGCIFTGTVSGVNESNGGIGGYLDECIVGECYSEGTVIGNSARTGGFVGTSKACVISNCYTQADVYTSTAFSYLVGGFCGNSQTTDEMINCYSAGTLSTTAPPDEYLTSGFCGSVHPNGTVTDSYFDIDLSVYDDPLANGESTADMMAEATFINWDFDNIWRIDEGSSYPYFIRNSTTRLTLDDIIYSKGDIKPILINTRLSPYKASSTDQIKLKIKVLSGDRLIYSEIPYSVYSNYDSYWTLVASGVTNKYGTSNVNIICSGITDINQCQFIVNTTYGNNTYSSNLQRVNFK